MKKYENIWAKNPDSSHPYPLVWHLLDSAAAMKSIYRVWVRPGLKELLEKELGPDTEELLMYFAGTHDVGKANPVFQLQLATGRKSTWAQNLKQQFADQGYTPLSVPFAVAEKTSIRRHERISAAHLAASLQLKSKEIRNYPSAFISLGHHGQFLWEQRDLPTAFKKSVGGEWTTIRDEITEFIGQSTGINKIPEISPVLQILISGLVILADRIASQEDTITNTQQLVNEGKLDPSTGDSWIDSQTNVFETSVRERLGTYNDFTNPTEEILGNNELNSAQALAERLPRQGLWIIKTATGSGKTELALLRHSCARESINFLLPTQATTDAMMRRMQDVYKKSKNVGALAHGSAWIDDFYSEYSVLPTSDNEKETSRSGLFPSEFVASRRERLLAPVTVATVDQALMAALPLKWTHLSLLSLANSHVVIDEVHTLDPYQTQLLKQLLWWLGRTNTRVTMLSATLPTEHRNEFISSYTNGKVKVQEPVVFPSLTAVSPMHNEVTILKEAPGKSYSIELQLVESSESVNDHVSWARAKREEFPHSRIGIVVNTISKAQNVAQALLKANHRVLVLHSRMTNQHRKEATEDLERLIGKHGDATGVTIVGTQTIEASLDIDLDLLSTDLAPAPSLVQRAGRVWRREDNSRKNRIPGISLLPLRIVRDVSKIGILPYSLSELTRVWDFLKERETLDVPSDIQKFVETSPINFEVFDAETARLNHTDLEYRAMIEQSLIEELARQSLKKQKAHIVSVQLANILRPDSTFSQMCELTKHDYEEDLATRYIEHETQRVVFTGFASKTDMPGAIETTLGELQMKSFMNRTDIKNILRGQITVSGKLVHKIRESGIPLETVPLLSGTLFMSFPAWLKYDPIIGLMEVVTDGHE